MRIVVVEDIEDQAEWLVNKLRSKYSSAKVDHIRTESDFRNQLEGIRENPPDLILMDMMLRWADPSPDIPPRPDDVLNGDFHRAGLRCIRLLREDPRSKDVPVIIVTVLEDVDFGEGELPENTTYVTKEANDTGLLAAIDAKLRPVPKTK